VFEAIVHDLRMLLREIAERAPHPTAAILDSRTLQPSPESGARAAYDGARRRKGSNVHIAVDTLGHLLALFVTPANEQDRAQVAELAQQVQEAAGAMIEVAFVDQGYIGAQPAGAAHARGIRWRSSSCPPPSADSCCCHGAGSWSAASPGRPVFGVWFMITSGCPALSLACISCPSRSSCSRALFA
jgi:transposase